MQSVLRVIRINAVVALPVCPPSLARRRLQRGLAEARLRLARNSRKPALRDFRYCELWLDMRNHINLRPFRLSDDSSPPCCVCVVDCLAHRRHAARVGRQASVPDTSPNMAAADRAVIDQYSVTCHNQRLKTGDLTLDSADLNDVAAHPDVWEKVIRKVDAGMMPPAGMPRPDEATKRALVSRLEDVSIAPPGRAEPRASAGASTQSRRVHERDSRSPRRRARRVVAPPAG